MTIPSEITFVAALLVGFLGSTHCIGMCGGIAGSLAAASASGESQPCFNRATYLLSYNAGRVCSYTIAGILAASLGHIGLGFLSAPVAHAFVMTVSIVFLLALGAYLAGWWSFLPRLELLGARLWRAIEPVGRSLLPVTNRRSAFLFGVVWGWLPCGLVYSALAWSMATADPIQGALLMSGFGLGTLPTVIFLGAAGQTLQRLRRHAGFRQAAGVSLIVFAAGMFALYKSNEPAHVHHHDQPATETGMSPTEPDRSDPS